MYSTSGFMIGRQGFIMREKRNYAQQVALWCSGYHSGLWIQQPEFESRQCLSFLRKIHFCIHVGYASHFRLRWFVNLASRENVVQRHAATFHTICTTVGIDDGLHSISLPSAAPTFQNGWHRSFLGGRYDKVDARSIKLQCQRFRWQMEMTCGNIVVEVLHKRVCRCRPFVQPKEGGDKLSWWLQHNA